MRGGRAGDRRLEASLGSLVSSLGEDAAGELYVVAYSYRTSPLYRLG
jgi:hypothetical protein